MVWYFECVENNVCMIMVFNFLVLDMFWEVCLFWKGLVVVIGMEVLFDQYYQKVDECNCVKFLVVDSYNFSFIVFCFWVVWENVCIIWDQVFIDVWEVINEFYWFVQEYVDSGVSK